MEEIRKCHFIGIGGIGMSGLAHLLLQNNCSVSGSDIAFNDRIQFLNKSGVHISLMHHAENIPEGSSVVYTSMVNEKNPEFHFAKQLNLPLLHRSDLLNKLMKNTKPLLVAGSHGKTTTTSLLAWVLECAGLDPTYAIGGVLLNSATNAKKGTGAYFVAEADESDGTFIKYQGYGAIVTNISHEHMDYYKSEASLLEHFSNFINKVENLFWCAEDHMLQVIKPKGVSYGFCESDLKGSNFRQEENGIFFDVTFQGKCFQNISLPILGKHNGLNALAVFGLCLSLGIPEEEIRNAFMQFKGVSRRMETKGEAKGVLVIDDYAHHPKEIATTINTLRISYPWRRIVVLYQPHRYSRTLHCKGSFHSIFDAADLTFVTDIYGAMEEPIEGINAFTVINETKGNCYYLPKGAILTELVKELCPLDILLVLGAGDITSYCAPLLSVIQEKLEPLKLGIIYGGRSQEHEISLLSAKSVEAGIDEKMFKAHFFSIDKEGKWQHGMAGVTGNEVPKAVQKEVLTEKTLQELLQCDLVFPVMHGPYGEDGRMQGFLETMGIAHMNCSSEASAICMNKAILKKIAQYHDLPILPFVDFSAHDWETDKENILLKIAHTLTYPVFVKPAHLGSTVGVVKVNALDLLEESIANALQFDTHILVESGVEGREIEFALYGEGHICVFAPGEIMINGNVYDYNSKYGENAVSANPSAELPKEAIHEGMALAKKAYQIACCDGFARVDFFYDKNGLFYLNEINPIPGFTEHSLYPKICEKNGIGYSAFIKQLAAIGLSKKRKLLKLK